MLALTFPTLILCQSVEYPYTKKDIRIDTFYNTTVEDEYRWLEDLDSEDVRNWIEEQNKYTNKT